MFQSVAALGLWGLGNRPAITRPRIVDSENGSIPGLPGRVARPADRPVDGSSIWAAGLWRDEVVREEQGGCEVVLVEGLALGNVAQRQITGHKGIDNHRLGG